MSDEGDNGLWQKIKDYIKGFIVKEKPTQEILDSCKTPNVQMVYLLGLDAKNIVVRLLLITKVTEIILAIISHSGNALCWWV
jgi:hypothetical protein